MVRREKGRASVCSKDAGFSLGQNGLPLVADHVNVCTAIPSMPINFRVLGALQQGDSALALRAWIETTDTGRIFPGRVLIDSGASGSFVDKRFVDKHFITCYRLEDPIPVRNADGTENQGGPIEEFIDVWIDILNEAPMFTHRERLRLEITQLGDKFDVILGYPWLYEHNPTINWQAGSMIFDHCAHSTNSMRATVVPTPDRANELELMRKSSYCITQEEIHADMCNALQQRNKTPLLERSAQMSIVSSSGIPGRTPDELPSPPSLNITHVRRQTQDAQVAIGDHSRTTSVEDDMKSFVPEKYWEYSDIFLKSSFDSLPPHSEFDHAITLTPDFIPQRGKKYALSPREQQELDNFLDENLTTGRIRPSKSPQAAPFFFANKVAEINAPNADPGLRPIQDYRYLNKHTVKD